ncbi:uncharacterized protein LOC113308141 isoform X1 [Papaver somniferum]|uniref:uncharacterized protein LOC113308141 isoform X1 n=1 Tax=Papaver somniferum TaxID=3469 RepID=UPI000E706006|nr:uncharacterized protein LOC113308141 isoform X1 [Papaver somniferum]
MDRRKSLRNKVAVEGDNVSRYVHPPEFRNKNMQITNFSSLPLLANVRDWLSVDEQAIFKGTSIGHLLSVPADSKFSSTIVHFLLSREIHIDGKPDEMHFKVGGKILHFGKREFALITGLSFKKPEKAFVSPRNPSSLMRTHFPNQNHISGSEVKDLLSKRNPTCPSLDRVKLALLLVVHRFLMSHQDRDAINIRYWHLVDNLEEFNKYPWGEVAFNRLKKSRSALLYQANKENSDSYKGVGITHALLVWALDIMPGLLDLCGRKIKIRGWQPHMLCVLCIKYPMYPLLIRTLDVNNVHVCSDIMWQNGDENHLIELGLEEGNPELSHFIRTENVIHEFHGEDSLHEREDGNQSDDIPRTAPGYLSKKRKISIEENENNIPHASVKDYRGKHVQIGNMPSCSGSKTTGVESLEVGELLKEPVDAAMSLSTSKGLTPDSALLNISTSIDVISSPPGFTRALALERVEGFEFVENFKIPEEHAALYKIIYEKYGHMATRKVIKFNDDMLLTCVINLLKIISAMENMRCSELTEALLQRWEGSIKDAEALEFNIKWLREGFNRLKNHWRSSFERDNEVETDAQALDAMHVYLSTREDELNALILEVKVQKRKAEETISSERKAIQEKLSQKIKFQNESVIGLVLN